MTLHAQTAPATLHPVGPDEMSLDVFRARCEAMREERASKAWGIELELPPRPAEPDEAMTQRPSAAKREQTAREERRRVALAASGGPLRRVAEL